MKILCLMDSVSRANGGIFHAERRLQQSLAEDRSVSVQVMGMHDEFAAEDGPAWLPLKPKVFPTFGPRGFGYSPGLRRAVLAAEADLAYCAGLWKYHVISSLQWSRTKRKPLVVSPHGMLDPWALAQSRGQKRFARLLYQNAQLEISSCIRALCHAEARAIRTAGLRNPIAIIPNGIDLPRSGVPGGTCCTHTANGSDRKVLLYLGRLHPKKGLINLLRAWRLALADTRPAGKKWVLAIAGWDQGRHESELKDLATTLGLAWSQCPRASAINAQGSGSSAQLSVIFLGPQFGEAKEECYRVCDAFILPSLSEGVPMVVLEAWASRKPVWMTPGCNLPEGFAANAARRVESSVPSIVTGLRQLFEMGDSELRAMGNAGYQLAASRFMWPNLAEDAKSLFNWLLGGGPKPACVADY